MSTPTRTYDLRLFFLDKEVLGAYKDGRYLPFGLRRSYLDRKPVAGRAAQISESAYGLNAPYTFQRLRPSLVALCNEGCSTRFGAKVLAHLENVLPSGSLKDWPTTPGSQLRQNILPMGQIYVHSNSQHCPNPDNWRLQGEHKCSSSLVRSLDTSIRLLRTASKLANKLWNGREGQANQPKVETCRKQRVCL